MSAPYEQLLDATIQHLQDLKGQGVRFLPVAPETLAGFKSVDTSLRVPPRTVAAPAPPRLAPAALPPAQVSASAIAPVQESLLAPAPSVPSPVLDPQAKAEAMRELRERALACQKCPNLASARKNVVFGVGDISAALMFVGEAPGADEDVQGEPFVGAAGQLLTRIIQTMGLSRDTVYIGNILKCRPDTPGQSAGNRKPTSEEMKTCIPYLHEQIDLIQPKVLVGLGATAIEGLIGKTGITRLRGQWHTYRGIPLMPTFHPSYLLRNQALSEKRKVWEDMLQVMERLGMAISDKQRSYFLKS
jgi:uracil-DNA glycosylase family 4